jgi:hypothetical protein
MSRSHPHRNANLPNTMLQRQRSILVCSKLSRPTYVHMLLPGPNMLLRTGTIATLATCRATKAAARCAPEFAIGATTFPAKNIRLSFFAIAALRYTVSGAGQCVWRLPRLPLSPHLLPQPQPLLLISPLNPLEKKQK